MLPAKQQISLLVHLSKVDKNFADAERDIIMAAGARLGLSTSEIENLIEAPLEVLHLKNLPTEEKFECLYMIIHMMKADKKIFQSEIQFCERIAMRLGYKPGVIGDLSAYIYSDAAVATNYDHLRSIADKQLLHRMD